MSTEHFQTLTDLISSFLVQAYLPSPPGQPESFNIRSSLVFLTKLMSILLDGILTVLRRLRSDSELEWVDVQLQIEPPGAQCPLAGRHLRADLQLSWHLASGPSPPTKPESSCISSTHIAMPCTGSVSRHSQRQLHRARLVFCGEPRGMHLWDVKMLGSIKRIISAASDCVSSRCGLEPLGYESYDHRPRPSGSI